MPTRFDALLFCALSMGTPAAFAACAPVTGPDTNGSVYLICPAENPSAPLIVFAHGFVKPGLPVTIPLGQLVLPDGTVIPDLINSLGFAFAATSYPVNGLAIVEGTDDVKKLAAWYKQHVGIPSRVYLVGISEGGLVAAKAIESAPETFDGGLAACGPIGDFRYQIHYFMDVRVLFDYFFPGVIPGEPVSIPDEVMKNWDDCTTTGCTAPYSTLARQAMSAKPAEVKQLLATGSVPAGPDPIQSILDVLWYNVFATNDAIAKLGGQPYDNRFRFYFGSANDFQLNRRVRRFTADPAALAAIQAHYQTTGKLASPLVTLHTIQDQVVPYAHELLYGWKVLLSGSLPEYFHVPALRYGHCNFTTAEAVAALSVLVGKTAH